MSVIDIVKTYGKSKRFGKCTKANNVEIYKKKGDNTESDSEEAFKLFTNLEENVSKSETSRKRGRPSKTNRTKLNIEETDSKEESKLFIKLEENVSKSETSRKRGRPSKTNRTKLNIEETDSKEESKLFIKLEENVSKSETSCKRGRPPKTKIKIEEVAGSDIDEVNNKKAKSRNGNMSTEINVQEVWKPVEKNVKPEITRKRGRPSKQKNTELKLEVQASGTQEINNKTLNKRRGAPCLKPNIKHIDESEHKTLIENGMKSTSEITQNMTTRKRGRPFKKDNVAKYDENDLVNTETKHSRSFTEFLQFDKCYLRRSKSWSNYSANSFELLDLFSYRNKNRNSAAKGKSPKKLLHSSPRKMLHRSQHYDKTLKPTVDNKGNHEKQSLKNSSQFNTTHLQPVVDLNLLHTKFIIEEKLKSSLGLLMIRRYYNQQLAAEGKDNNFTSSHNAVKSELIKLKKLISLEKIEPYMEWYVSIWISQANNRNNHSKMGNASNDSMPTT